MKMREFILLLTAVVAAVAVNGEDHAQIEVRGRPVKHGRVFLVPCKK